jgi:predicted naringenin-chalcone synthase
VTRVEVGQAIASPARDRVDPAWPRLAGLGTATPALALARQDTHDRLAQLWGLSGSELDRWGRIVDGTGIDMRYGVLPPEQIVGLSTEGRMKAYERLAPGLAEQAARAALDDAAVDTDRVTDLVVVSCTGFSAPGVDVALVRQLGLAPTVRRTMIGFMGCFGAIIGLRSAVGACAVDSRSVCLVVCVELCTLHLRPDRSADNLVASALFGDGAAAAVVVGNRVELSPAGAGGAAGVGRLTTGFGRLIPQGCDWMTWRVTDAGFAMTLDRCVPAALNSAVAEIVQEATDSAGGGPDCYVVHPGGPGILDAVNDGLALAGGSGIEAARAILGSHGNMSSSAILFVLDEMLRHRYRPPAMLLAFGPGLAVETITLRPLTDNERRAGDSCRRHMPPIAMMEPNATLVAKGRVVREVKH